MSHTAIVAVLPRPVGISRAPGSLPQPETIVSVPLEHGSRRSNHDAMERVYEGKASDMDLEASTQTLWVRWKKMHVSADLRGDLTQGLALVRRHGVRHWVADVSGVTTPTQKDDQVWIAEQGPKFIEAGLKSIVTVVPKSAIAKLSTKGWQGELQSKGAGFVMVDVASLEEAAQVIAQRSAA